MHALQEDIWYREVVKKRASAEPTPPLLLSPSSVITSSYAKAQESVNTDLAEEGGD